MASDGLLCRPEVGFRFRQPQPNIHIKAMVLLYCCPCLKNVNWPLMLFWGVALEKSSLPGDRSDSCTVDKVGFLRPLKNLSMWWTPLPCPATTCSAHYWMKALSLVVSSLQREWFALALLQLYLLMPKKTIFSAILISFSRFYSEPIWLIVVFQNMIQSFHIPSFPHC